MGVRCRFRLDSVKVSFGDTGGAEITLSAMYDDKIAEDMRFMKATPWGQITQKIDNPDAIKFFQKPDGEWRLGDYFYLDIIDAPPYGA